MGNEKYQPLIDYVNSRHQNNLAIVWADMLNIVLDLGGHSLINSYNEKKAYVDNCVINLNIYEDREDVYIYLKRYGIIDKHDLLQSTKFKGEQQHYENN